MPENLVSRDGFNRPVPRQPAHLHTQAESGGYLRDSSRVPRRRPFMKPPYAIGSVPSLSGHAIAYRWRLLPRVRQHRASKPQGSSEQVLHWQVTMDQLIFASLPHTRNWYEVGMLKVECSSKVENRELGQNKAKRGQKTNEEKHKDNIQYLSTLPISARKSARSRSSLDHAEILCQKQKQNKNGPRYKNGPRCRYSLMTTSRAKTCR